MDELFLSQIKELKSKGKLKDTMFYGYDFGGYTQILLKKSDGSEIMVLCDCDNNDNFIIKEENLYCSNCGEKITLPFQFVKT